MLFFVCQDNTEIQSTEADTKTEDWKDAKEVKYYCKKVSGRS